MGESSLTALMTDDVADARALVAGVASVWAAESAGAQASARLSINRRVSAAIGRVLVGVMDSLKPKMINVRLEVRTAHHYRHWPERAVALKGRAARRPGVRPGQLLLHEPAQHQQLAVKEMRGVGNDHHGKFVPTGEIHGFVQRHDIVGFAMHQQRVLRQGDVGTGEPLRGSAREDERLGSGLFET